MKKVRGKSARKTSDVGRTVIASLREIRAWQRGELSLTVVEARITTHPGEVLSEEFLKPLGLSVNALAMALRVPATRIGAIVKGERAVTADTALRLARFFGTSPEFWISMQATHDLTKARRERGAAIERDVRPRPPSRYALRRTSAA
jgi:addiction module HigA family antidote